MNQLNISLYFHTQNIETILITEPFILTTSNRWKEAVDQDILCKDALGNPFTYNFYFGNTGLIDLYNPKATSWFWGIYKNLHLMGINGFWGDLGEPEVHPKELLHSNYSANEVHNVYGHDWARILSEGYKREFPKERPFILMRAGAAGEAGAPPAGAAAPAWQSFPRDRPCAAQCRRAGHCRPGRKLCGAGA